MTFLNPLRDRPLWWGHSDQNNDDFSGIVIDRLRAAWAQQQYGYYHAACARAVRLLAIYYCSIYCCNSDTNHCSIVLEGPLLTSHSIVNFHLQVPRALTNQSVFLQINSSDPHCCVTLPFGTYRVTEKSSSAVVQAGWRKFIPRLKSTPFFEPHREILQFRLYDYMGNLDLLRPNIFGKKQNKKNPEVRARDGHVS